MDLGVDAAVPGTAAKKMVLQEAGGDVARAQQAWTAAGLPGNGPVSVDQLASGRGDDRAYASDRTWSENDNSKKRESNQGTSLLLRGRGPRRNDLDR